jgi:glycine oxidase
MAASGSTSSSSDVIVVGGGLIGCAIAFRLAQTGARVAVFERGTPGCEASSAGAGMIAPQGETVEANGFYRLCAASRDLYPQFVAEIEEMTGQSVNFRRDGTLMTAVTEHEAAMLDSLFKAQSKAGLPLARLTAAEAREQVPLLSPQVAGGLVAPQDYWLDNEMLVRCLHAACMLSRVSFYAHTEVMRFSVRNCRVESIETRCELQPAGHRHSAGTFVLACGAWSAEAAASLGVQLPVRPCRGQMMEFEGANDFPLTVRSGHYYLVPRSEGRIVAGSTMEYAGFEKSVSGEGMRSILDGVCKFAPFIKNLRFRRAWAGLRPDTEDHNPILGYGRFENLVYATGHFRNGILLAPLTGQLICELISSGSCSIPIEEYSPARFSC